jgi:5'-3' exonuclease
MMIHRRINNRIVKTKTLLIDGEVLLKIGFFATRNTIAERGRVYTILNFLTTIKKFYIEYAITKVVVFWEGGNSRSYRQSFYPYYKANRDALVNLTDEEYSDLQTQRRRIKQYLEELSIRQIQEEDSEADDCIAYYTQHSPNEHKIVFTNDKDLLQLLSDNTDVYLADYTKKFLVTNKNFHQHFPYHHRNVALIKMIGGDPADNISGIEGVAEATVLKHFPELKSEEKNVEWLRERARQLLTEQPNNNAVTKIVDGQTKWGTYGEDYFAVMKEVISLEPPHLTPEGVEDLEMIKECAIDPAGRGGVQKVLRMFLEDGIRINNSNNDEAFFEYWQPFQIIIKKEQDYYKQSQLT